jgi:organic radical activating enzyme
MEGIFIVLWVNDISPSFQGEGKYIGTSIVILRMMVCNLKCKASEGGFDCDTYYTWDKSRLATGRRLEAKTIIEEVNSYYSDSRKTIMLTGGEPLIWQNNREFTYVLSELKKFGWVIHLETNGTQKLEIAELIDFAAISPKQTQYKDRYTNEIVHSYDKIPHIWKFVIRTKENMSDAVNFLISHKIPEIESIYLMPEGITSTQLKSSIETIINPNIILFLTYNYRKIYISNRRQIVEGYK